VFESILKKNGEDIFRLILQPLGPFGKKSYFEWFQESCQVAGACVVCSGLADIFA
jgi:hypothetical protein